MGFFDKIRRSVGIGGAKVEIKLATSPVPLGSSCKGQVILRRTHVERVLVEGKMQDQEQQNDVQKEKVLSYTTKIYPESETGYDFAVRIPNEAGGPTQIKYHLYATADIPGAIDPSCKLEPDNTAALRQMAETVGYRNEAEAVPLWKKYLTLVPADVKAWEELAGNAERRRAYPEALQHFDNTSSWGNRRCSAVTVCEALKTRR